MEHEVCTASRDDIEASASAGSAYCSAEEDDEIVDRDGAHRHRARSNVLRE
ncbi:hypothetical protein PC121_g10167 [Phytophthora cactorum]|nr:hypothetical protein PC120_g17636 [Phytophthora cactorum]KAG3068574.1 hypothetical protein PC121_g10167 [Phytophthora cactorum]KAG4056757.1 hypothetical protein PC123_g8202 [Phytophthora cactorum]